MLKQITFQISKKKKRIFHVLTIIRNVEKRFCNSFVKETCQEICQVNIWKVKTLEKVVQNTLFVKT